jgi:hypothetical protein
VQAFFGFAEYGFAFEKPITAVEGNQNCSDFFQGVCRGRGSHVASSINIDRSHWSGFSATYST